MHRVTQEDIEGALTRLGVVAGDNILVHSNLMRFGRPENGAQTYIDACQRVLGPKGTLAVPAFSFSFIQTGVYHWSDTRSEGMGAFAEAVRKHPDAKRTRHPLQSLALIGQNADEMASIETPSAYASDGVFQKACDLSFKIVVLGAEPGHISHSHLSEEKAQVPYRFEKIVQGHTCLGKDDLTEETQWSFFARDLDLNVLPTGEDTIVAELVEDGLWVQTSFNEVGIFAGHAASFVSLLDAKLAADALWMAPDRDQVAQKLNETDQSNG